MGTHTLDKLSTSPIFTECRNSTGYQWTDVQTDNPFHRVKVGNDVWIGTGVMVMGGVTIGDGAVIGAGAIVTKDVPPYAVVAGVPAKIIRYRFPEDTIELLNKIKWWEKDETELKEHIVLFQKTVNEDTIMNVKKLLQGGNFK
jgi:acetyltransferase-like isoleucine patch superfamily enzyme